MPPRKALILGITGTIGAAVAAALHHQGWQIAALSRRPGTAPFPVEWHQGDALDAAAVRRAAQGCEVIFHGVNPPGYRRWREDGLPMLAAALAAAQAEGSRLLFPGNTYVFSPASGARVDEATPHTPTTRKGRVRAEMEAMLAASAARTLVLRAGDFFGPGVVNSWFAQALAKGGRQARTLRSLGTAGHAWAYVPDLAEAFARLAAIEATLPAHVVFHFAGHWDETGSAMAEAAQRALAPRQVPIRPFPWWLTRLAAPVVPFLREAQEMRWLWNHPLRLDNRALEAAIGPEPHTPLQAAIAAALA
jgi:nucleoside-diphosphate-sugar epimerase